MPREVAARQALCADVDGFSPHAAVRIEANERRRLERLCRTITRPALSDERIRVNAAGQVELELKARCRLGSRPTYGQCAAPRQTVRESLERGASPRHRLKDTDSRRELGSELPVRDSDVVLGLQVQPKPGLHAKEQPEPKRCIRGDGTLAIHQFADPARRDIDVRRESAGADAHGLHEVLEQDLAWMNLVKQLTADPPRVVDAEAVLAFAVGFQCLQWVTRRDAQADEFRGGVDLKQLAPRDALDVAEAGYRTAAKDGLSIGAQGVGSGGGAVSR
jgi:hypothetical protein